jgi:hypothetical protein
VISFHPLPYLAASVGPMEIRSRDARFALVEQSFHKSCTILAAVDRGADRDHWTLP